MGQNQTEVGANQTTNWMKSVTWMAVIAATGVGVIYIPQPIQPLLAIEFGIDAAWSSAASVSVQAGYALGVLFLVALGDRFSARKQVTTQLGLTTLALVATALAPHYVLVVILFFVAGAMSTVGQILVSSALRLSPPEKRARTAATIVGAIVIGLFTVRTLLGSLAEVLGWRGAVLVVALIVAALIPISWRYSPPASPVDPPRYSAILASIPAIVMASDPLRRMAAIHTLVFAAFIALWSLTTLHAVEEFGISVTQASLLGVAGIAGGVFTMVATRLQATLGPVTYLAITLVAALLASIFIGVWPDQLWLMCIALFLLAFAMSSEQMVTQATALRSVAPSESGRANTVYMASTFIGSSVATAIAAVIYATFGYSAIAWFAIAAVVLASVVALGAHRKNMLTG
jgi:predicted MFS family arabinose efflux permease